MIWSIVFMAFNLVFVAEWVPAFVSGSRIHVTVRHRSESLKSSHSVCDECENEDEPENKDEDKDIKPIAVVLNLYKYRSKGCFFVVEVLEINSRLKWLADYGPINWETNFNIVSEILKVIIDWKISPFTKKLSKSIWKIIEKLNKIWVQYIESWKKLG